MPKITTTDEKDLLLKELAETIAAQKQKEESEYRRQFDNEQNELLTDLRRLINMLGKRVDDGYVSEGEAGYMLNAIMLKARIFGFMNECHCGDD